MESREGREAGNQAERLQWKGGSQGSLQAQHGTGMEIPGVLWLLEVKMELNSTGKWNQDGGWAVPRTWCLCSSKRKCLWRVSSFLSQQGKAVGLPHWETFRKPAWHLPGTASAVENRSLKKC